MSSAAADRGGVLEAGGPKLKLLLGFGAVLPATVLLPPRLNAVGCTGALKPKRGLGASPVPAAIVLGPAPSAGRDCGSQLEDAG